MQQIQLTSNHLIALLPILAISATIVVTMLSIAFKRNQTLTASISIAGLILTAVAIIPAVCVINSAPNAFLEVTTLLGFDRYAYFTSATLIFIAIACSVFAYIYLQGYEGNRDEFYLLLLLSTLGGFVLVSTHHLLGLFIGLELLSIPMYGLVGYSFFKRHSLEAAIKYMVLSAVGSAFLLFGMALVFADTGSLTFEAISNYFFNPHTSKLIDLGLALMIVGLSFKLSLVPFHLWTPDVYQGAPAPAAAFLATASKLATFAMLVRLMAFIPVSQTMWLSLIITVIAIASILVGNLLALFQYNMKRLLGYSSISHFGYLLIVLLVNNEMASQTASIYLFTYVMSTLGAFGIVSILSSPVDDRDADALYRYRGLFWHKPLLAVSLSVMMLSLAGVPLMAGFIGKFWLLRTAINAELWLLTATVILGSAIGLYYYLRVMVTLFMPQPTEKQDEQPSKCCGHCAATAILVIITAIVLFVGIYPSPLISLVEYAGSPITSTLSLSQ